LSFSTSAHFTALTLALLEDSGWYKADFTKAENSPFGLNSGCGFATEDCIVNGDLPAYSEGNFCNDYAGNKISTCGPGHKFRGVCDLFDYRLSGGSLARPEREYFSNVYFGPKISVLSDYCPTVVRFAGFSADCNDLSATKIDKVEVFSDNSRCMDVSINNGSKTSVCISGTCDNDAKRYVFDVGNKSYYCGYGEDGTTIKASHNGKSYSFTCPRLVQVCPE
jgi:leishmanolysin